MSAWPYILLVLGLVWLVIELRTGRPDGTFVPVHPYRRMLAFITPSAAASTVTFDMRVPADPLLAYLDDAHPIFGAHLTHAVVAAGYVALSEVPRMNRFVAGKRLYQRHGEWVTFSMKRKKLDRSAKIAMVKDRLVPGETFRELCARMDGRIDEQRADAPTHEDREYGILDSLPRPFLAGAVALARWLDHHGLLPGWFMAGDGLFTSLVVANLGSLGMGAGYHHLYEWGNCPLFLVVGAVEASVAVVDGEMVVRKELPLRFTYDERIDDGLNARFGLEAVVRVLSHPREELGCLTDDGSDAVALDRGRPGAG